MSVLTNDLQLMKEGNESAKVIGRDLTAVKMDLGNGKHQVMVSSGPVHYKKEGLWEEIDINIVDEGLIYAVRKNLCEVEFSKDSVPTIKIAAKDKFFKFTPVRLQYTNANAEIQVISDFVPDSQVEINGNTIKWLNAFGTGIHLEYYVGTASLKKNVVVDDFTNLPYCTLVNVPVLEIVLKMEGSLDLNKYKHLDLGKLRLEKLNFIADSDSCEGSLELGIPRYKDSGIGVMPDFENEYFETVGYRRIYNKGKDIFICTSADWDWVRQAVYPLYLDTDVNYQTAASGDDGSQLNDAGYAYTSTTDSIGHQEGSQGADQDRDTCMRFASVAVPKSATVSNCYIQIYITVAETGMDSTFYGIAEDNTATMTSSPFARTKTTGMRLDDSLWSSVAINDFRSSPAISTEVQEIVNRAGWVSGNAMGFLWYGIKVGDLNDYLTYRQYDYAGNVHGPKLFITYTAAGNSNFLPFFV